MRDPKAEAWLAAEGVKFTFHADVPLKSIDSKVSLMNQARIGEVLNSDRVTEYALAMLEGADFPAVIAYKGDKGFVFISGNHRFAAAVEAEKKSLDLYEVKSTDRYVLDRLTRSANSIEGQRSSREEGIQHALYLISTYNSNVKEVCEALKIPASSVNSALRIQRTKDRLREMNKPIHAMPKRLLEALPTVRNDRALSAIADLYLESKLNLELMTRLIKEVNESRSEEAQLAAVVRWRGRPEVQECIARTRRGKSAGKLPQRAVLFRNLSALHTFIAKFTSLDPLQITTPADIDRLNSLWAQISKQMEKLLHAQAHTPGKARPRYRAA